MCCIISKEFSLQDWPKTCWSGKHFLKSVYMLLLFIKQILFIDSNLFFIFFFDILEFFTGIHFRATQNMFNALKSKPLSFTLILLRWKNNEQQTFGTWTFPQVFISLSFNYIWINFQVFLSHVSGYWFFYLFLIFYSSPSGLSTMFPSTIW